MTTTIEREINQPTNPARPVPLLKRRVSAGEVEQRFARGRSKAVTVEVRRKAPPIRAWRAADTDPSQTPKEENRATPQVAAAAPRQPFGRDAGAGSRLSAFERASRMRAIEQAWKEERARQAELEAEKQRRAEAAARERAAEARQIDELKRQAEAQRAAEERARLTIEQVRRFRAKAEAEVQGEKTEDAAERGDTHGLAKRAKRAPARRDDQTGRRERRLSVVTALDADAEQYVRSLASIRRQREKLRAGPAAPAAQKVIRDVAVPETSPCVNLRYAWPSRPAPS